MLKVLVAGATGYLGKFVVQEFKRQGYWVRALVRNPAKLAQVGTFLEPAVNNDIDEVFVGEVTKPETLPGLCDDIDIVFSSIGITRQRDKVSFMDVDYQGNKNILDIALASPVQKFIFVSVYQAHLFQSEIVKARELFVKELMSSGLDYTIIRPTGYFSDMSEFLKMASSGRFFVIGGGQNRMNPIHGMDLAKVCADAVRSKEQEIPVGGPDIYTQLEIAALAFSILGKPAKISRIPLWLAKLLVSAMHPLSKRYYALASFFFTGMQLDMVAPKTGTHTLKEYYRELLDRGL